MLSAWNNADNINQGPRGGKTRKPLGYSGLSENAPVLPGKGVPLPEAKGIKQRRPLGFRSENTPHVVVGKVGREVDSKPKQRKALGDISNARKGSHGGSGSLNGAKLGGKQPPPGLKFSVHSDSRHKDGSSASAGKASVPQSISKPRVFTKESEKAIEKPENFVDDVEIVMGRTWEEEDVLVQKKNEQRAAKAVNPFRPASKRTPRVKVDSFPIKASPSTASIDEAVSVQKKERTSQVNAIDDSDHRLKMAIDRMVLRDLEGASIDEAVSVQKKEGTSQVNAIADSDHLLKMAIDRMVLRDLEGAKEPTIDNEKLLGDSMDEDLSLDWLVKVDDILESPPLSPVDDGILTEDLDLSFA